MIKNDIALAIEKKSEFNRAKSLLIVESILESLKAALARNEKVEIRGFGSFRVVAKKTGYGRDRNKSGSRRASASSSGRDRS